MACFESTNESIVYQCQTINIQNKQNKIKDKKKSHLNSERQQ